MNESFTPPVPRGQALILIALAFVGLAAFIGLAIDAGILFSQIGHLRRATDAAALAAANQFREGRTGDEIQAAATEFINLNSLNPATAEVFVCRDYFNPATTPASMHDPDLCPPPGDPPRKYVRVRAQMPVDFAFLPIVGWRTVDIFANAVSEAASIDLVLVIDTSATMAWDLCRDGIDNDAWKEQEMNGAPDGVVDDCIPPVGTGRVGAVGEDDPLVCNENRQRRIDTGDDATYPSQNDCHPFEEVRAASGGLLGQMRFPFDRMALITFDQMAHVQLSLQDGDDFWAVNDPLFYMSVGTEPERGLEPCVPNRWGPGTIDPRGCTSTNTAEALRYAGNQFGLYKRDEAVWIVIFLSDGGANAALKTGGNASQVDDWLCPGSVGQPTWIQPYCRDPDGATRHLSTDPLYDVDDAARDFADFIGCPDSMSPQPDACDLPGQGAVIFTIGLGDKMINEPPSACAPFYGGACDPDLGEQLMRYVAGAGDDNDPGTPPSRDPCHNKPMGTSCGNYYFSPTGAGLMDVFEAIASRIFTRLTR